MRAAAATPARTPPARRATLALLAVAASAVLAALAARGAWPLMAVVLLPWVLVQPQLRSWRATLGLAVLMAMAFCAAVLPWFGAAIGRFTGWGEPAGFVALLLLAPLLQPQFLAWALLRRVLDPQQRPLIAPLLAALAWVAVEWAWPKPLGDTLGHGLFPAPLLRLAAEVGGTAGLTLLVLGVHEALAAALARRQQGLRVVAAPLGLALALPLAAALYGLWAAQPEGRPGAPPVPVLRMGLVQSNITNYEQLRREKGAAAVVREVLDVHYAMSHDAVERQKVDAVLWSETVYPTTFGRPKSEAGAELDAEILGIVEAAGVPFVFGTYDRDAAGEYNSAAFVQPGRGLLGHYRKLRPFPFSEAVPAWLDGPALRRLLPWAGGWRAGDAVRVFPLRLRDGREVPVLPLICRDAVDPSLALEGARLGASVIVGLSNDSWFGDGELGARLHLAVAAFRSIETRLPQFRVTTSGVSAVIDRDGTLLATTRRGERTLVVGDLPVREPRRTLVVAWGDWVGRTAAAVLLLAGLAAAWRRWAVPAVDAGGTVTAPAWRDGTVARVAPPWAHGLIVLLQAAAALWLLALAGAALLGLPLWPGNTLAQLRLVGLGAGVPAGVALALGWAWRARLSVQGGELVARRGARELRLPAAVVLARRPWRWPWPQPGFTLQLADGTRWAVAGVEPDALGGPFPAADAPPTWATRLAQARPAHQPALARPLPRALSHPAVRFGLLPLLMAVPAFRLHQHIAFGGSFGEWQAFGPGAFALGFALWWAAWAVGALLVAVALRAAIEAALLLLALRPGDAARRARVPLEWCGHALLFLGMPAWLAWRALGA